MNGTIFGYEPTHVISISGKYDFAVSVISVQIFKCKLALFTLKFISILFDNQQLSYSFPILIQCLKYPNRNEEKETSQQAQISSSR